ncbi:MAG TPA: LLM class flavin-dependent oxidoreductase [Polyangiaceae bacterium]|jgi:luciferase family oxidoreductase group 1|nr:LLM class flavin-dependent oxidoreductase [Polyangiaceae bacterium]
MAELSILDLAPITRGSNAGEALRRSLDLAQHAERWGFTRFWMAEHHNMPGVASAATAVALGFVAQGTSRIRVGAGGIMLPNHAPLVVAEQFGTLAALYPGRIDLGLGRAPGTDQVTLRALRRHQQATDAFPESVVELIRYLEPETEGQAIRAVPGAGTRVPVWLLGSSLYSAQLAAALGLPFAFAAHFAPELLHEALAIYREQFRPSPAHEKPHAMACINVYAADTDAEARRLLTSLEQAFLALRSGRPTELPPPLETGEHAAFEPAAKEMLAQLLRYSVVGGPRTVRQGIADFVRETQVDELMTTAMIFDHPARLRSFEILAEVYPPAGGA